MLNLPVRILLPALILSAVVPILNSQGDTSAAYRVDVNMVVLTFRVTDKKGNHVSGLKPEDIRGRHRAEDRNLCGRQQAVPAGERWARVRRHECVRPIRHQQSYVHKLSVCLRCHRRLHQATHGGGLGGVIYLQPQSVSRRAAYTESQHGESGAEQHFGR